MNVWLLQKAICIVGGIESDFIDIRVYLGGLLVLEMMEGCCVLSFNQYPVFCREFFIIFKFEFKVFQSIVQGWSKELGNTDILSPSFWKCWHVKSKFQSKNTAALT